MPMGTRYNPTYNKAGTQTGTVAADEWYGKSRRRMKDKSGKTLSDSRFRRGPQGRRNASKAPTLMQALMMGGVL